MRLLIKLILLPFFPVLSFAQNLLPNAGFEDINICTEYTAPCSSEAWFYIKPTEIPKINLAAPPKLLGNECLWVPVTNIYYTHDKKQLIYTALLCKMERGRKYRLSFYIHTLGRPYRDIDVGFSRREPTTNGFEAKDVDTVLQVKQEYFMGDVKGWQFVEMDYTANGRERFFLIGNISNKIYRFDERMRMHSQGMIYYFVDEMMLSPLQGTQPCPDAETIRKKMYEHNPRHTDATVFEPLPPVKIITDTIKIPSAYFETNKAILKPTFKKLADDFIVKLKDKIVTSIKIIGHTDAVGKDEDNLILSQARADAVKRYILMQRPDFAVITTAEGKGETMPIADNNSAAGRTLNRRVEIILSCEEEVKQ